jgi:branched-chain amino acid transport system ATP-binding protein
MLQIQEITKKFGGLVALDSVSFTVNAGEIFGLIGPNGAGKTTLLNVIAGVYKPDGGTVTFRGERVSGQSSYKICNKGIARTFQISKPFPAMTALENVKVAAVFGRGGSAEDPEGKARGVLEFVEFPMPEDTLAENLNALQLKRLDLARALASDPELLLLDEVAAGLRPTEYQELINLIVRVRDSGVTLIVVEHVMRLIMQICDRLGVLYYGRKIAEGPRDEVARDETVIEAYLGEDYLS